MSPADRAARVRVSIERIFGRNLFFNAEFYAHLEERIREEIIEHEIDVRGEAGE
jgi:hypothetical protein